MDLSMFIFELVLLCYTYMGKFIVSSLSHIS